ncbi:hypothetical protein AB0N99_30835 [Streptomyces sp. NPDC093272]|uniref:hypothetical protein n=1 Tax=Streptomyces sp. NPDC093272 TaxID=3154981 RepID=UPI003449B475
MSETVRVGLSDDYYRNEQFVTDPAADWSRENVYEVPREQAERWQAAQDAWEAAQQEMGAIMNERRPAIRRGQFDGRMP